MLSKLYKNSPYLTLDENVTDSTEFEAQPVNKNENDELLIEKMKLSLTHQIQLHLRNFQAKENKSKEYNKR